MYKYIYIYQIHIYIELYTSVLNSYHKAFLSLPRATKPLAALPLAAVTSSASDPRISPAQAIGFIGE